MPPSHSPSPSAPAPWRRLHTEDGALSAEHVGVVVVIGLVVAALVSAPIVPSVAAWGRYAVCSLFSGDCERPPGDVADVAAPPDWSPSKACTVSSSENASSVSLGILVASASADDSYLLEEQADGRWYLTWGHGEALGVGANAGIMLEAETGDEDFGSGAYASADARMRFETTETWRFGSQEEALAYGEWHRQMVAPSERLDTPLQWTSPMTWGGRDSLQGRLNRGIGRVGNTIASWFGGGIEEPPAPVTVERFHSVGGDGEAQAYGGFLFGADASADASALTMVGWSELPETGERRYELKGNTQVLLQAGLNTAETAEATATTSGGMSVTVDADGRPTELEVSYQALGEPGRDLAALQDPREVMTWIDSDAGSPPRSPSLYQVSITLDAEDFAGDFATDVGDLMAIQTDVASGGQLGIADALWDRSTIGVVEYEPNQRHYGGQAGAGLGVHVSGSMEQTATELGAVGAHYFDRNTGAYTPWLRCLE